MKFIYSAFTVHFKPTCTPRADEDNEEEAVPFGLSWGMQNDSDDDNAVRVNKGDKEVTRLTYFGSTFVK